MRPTRARRTMLAFALGATAVAYLDRVCISTAAPAIKADLGLDDAQMGYVFSAFTLAYALFEVPSGWLADRFGARLMLTRIVLWWSAMTAATGLGAGLRVAGRRALALRHGRSRRVPEPDARLRPLAPGARARRRLRAHVDGGGPRRRGDAAAGGRAARARLVAPGVPDLRRGGRRVRGRLVRVVPRRPAHAPQRERRRDRRDRRGPARPRIPPCPGAGSLRSRNLAALCAMYFGAIYGWYFYLTWLPDLSAARARLRSRRGRLAGRAAAARDRDRIAGRRPARRRAHASLGRAHRPAHARRDRASARGARDRGGRARARIRAPAPTASPPPRGSPRSASRPAGPSASRSAAATPAWCRGR